MCLLRAIIRFEHYLFHVLEVTPSPGEKYSELSSAKTYGLFSTDKNQSPISIAITLILYKFAVGITESQETILTFYWLFNIINDLTELVSSCITTNLSRVFLLLVLLLSKSIGSKIAKQFTKGKD